MYSIFPDGVAVSMCSVSDRSQHYVAAAQALSRLERVVLAAAKPVHHTTAKVVAGEDVGQRESPRRDSPAARQRVEQRPPLAQPVRKRVQAPYRQPLWPNILEV